MKRISIFLDGLLSLLRSCAWQKSLRRASATVSHSPSWYLILIAISLCLPHKASAWGRLGHRVSGLIASQNLKPQTAMEVQELLGDLDLGEAAIWADQQRGNPEMDFLKPYHYVSIPDGGTYSPAQADPNGDIVQGIKISLDILHGRKTSSKINRRQALLLLIHFVGDIQQPLHVGRKEDRGGNDIKVRFFGRRSNLHRMWDSNLLETMQMDEHQLAAYLTQNVRTPIGSRNQPLSLWLKEAVDLRPQVYKIMEDRWTSQWVNFFFPPYDFTDDCGQHHAHEGNTLSFFSDSSRKPKLGREYLKRNLKTAQQRLLLSGLRIAEVLNSVFK